MRGIYSTFKHGFKQIIFPDICVCCGFETTVKQRQICSFCLDKRFEDANPENKLTTGDTLLPEGILFQHALWLYDKGGDLQHLLHQLKYERLTTIGTDLGLKLGLQIRRHPIIHKVMIRDNTVLLPVPLHYLKFRSRGFNQAFKIAQGIRQVWPDIPILSVKSVVRHKNTRTQTGFNLSKRLKNLEGAFQVNNRKVISDKTIVIVDDVFTTGATTFELARTLKLAGCRETGILTIAQA